MRKFLRSLCVLLLLIVLLIEARSAAFAAQPGSVSARSAQSIYLLEYDNARSTHCVIVQMTENKDGTLSKSSEYDGKLPGTPTNAFYYRATGHLYLNLANGSGINKLIAQFEFGKGGQIYPTTPFITPGAGSGSLEAPLSNGLVLSPDLSAGTIDFLTVDAGFVALRLKTKLNLSSGSTNKPDNGNGPDDPKDMFTGVAAVNSSDSFFYVSKSNLADPTGDSIFQFRVTSAGKILPLNPSEIKAECGFLSVSDTDHRVLYSFLPYGDLRAFSIGPDGQLKALMKDSTARSEDYPISPEGGVVDDNLIRIYPVPPPPPPPIKLSRLTLDPNHSLLFGLGGIKGNEIYVWRTSSKGTGKLIYRYWCDESGNLKNADPDAGDNKNAMGRLAPSPIPVVSSDGQYLYLFRETLSAQSDVPQLADVYSYKVSPAGELHKSSGAACGGLDLSKVSLICPFVTYGTH